MFQRPALRAAGLALCFVIAVAAALCLYRHNVRQQLRHHIDRMDHEAILAACRNLMLNRKVFEQYSMTNSFLPPAARNVASLNSDALKRADVPSAIRSIQARYIVISEGDVFICLSVMPRAYLIAYATDAPQHGTRKLIDGLWFWDGS